MCNLPVIKSCILTYSITDSGKKLPVRSAHDNRGINKYCMRNGTFKCFTSLSFCSENSDRRSKTIITYGSRKRDKLCFADKRSKLREIKNSSAAKADNRLDIIHGYILGKRYGIIIACRLNQIEFTVRKALLYSIYDSLKNPLKIFLCYYYSFLLSDTRKHILHNSRDTTKDSIINYQMIWQFKLMHNKSPLLIILQKESMRTVPIDSK